MTPTLVVIAKAPGRGAQQDAAVPAVHAAARPPRSPRPRCATRSTPCSPRRGAARRVLVLDGAPGPWLPAGFEIVAQRGDGLGERLAAAFDDVGGPAFLVGMDTPQVTPRLLAAGLRALARRRRVARLAPDGGYWGIGLRAPDPAVFAGVPMSVDDTGAGSARACARSACATAMLPVLRDVDIIADARAVAALAPADPLRRGARGDRAGDSAARMTVAAELAPAPRPRSARSRRRSPLAGARSPRSTSTGARSTTRAAR